MKALSGSKQLSSCSDSHLSRIPLPIPQPGLPITPMASSFTCAYAITITCALYIFL